MRSPRKANRDGDNHPNDTQRLAPPAPHRPGTREKRRRQVSEATAPGNAAQGNLSPITLERRKNKLKEQNTAVPANGHGFHDNEHAPTALLGPAHPAPGACAGTRTPPGAFRPQAHRNALSSGLCRRSEPSPNERADTMLPWRRLSNATEKHVKIDLARSPSSPGETAIRMSSATQTGHMRLCPKSRGRALAVEF